MSEHSRREFLKAGLAAAASTLPAFGAGQTPNQTRDAMIAAIKAEGLRRSEAPVLFHTLTDAFGSRLTGSPAHLEAARWAVE